MSDGAALTTAQGGESSLAVLERARELLASVQALQDVVELDHQAAAVLEYRKREDKSSEAYALSWAVKLECRRRIGQITAAMPKAKPGRKPFPAAEGPPLIGDGPSLKSKNELLREAKLDSTTAARCERLAALPRDEYEARRDAGMARIRGGKDAKDPSSTTSASDYHSDEWCTPAKYIEAAREVFGGVIELDPASNALAQNTVRAQRWHHKRDSGLIVPWKAKSVYLNFPYSRLLALAFCEKFVAEFVAEHFGAGIVLSNSSTETGWYQNLLTVASAICLPDERIAFELQGRPVDDNRNAQTFFYAGSDVQSFHRVFSKFGTVLAPLRGFI